MTNTELFDQAHRLELIDEDHLVPFETPAVDRTLHPMGEKWTLQRVPEFLPIRPLLLRIVGKSHSLCIFFDQLWGIEAKRALTHRFDLQKWGRVYGQISISPTLEKML